MEQSVEPLQLSPTAGAHALSAASATLAIRCMQNPFIETRIGCGA
jgi:hypothetical protein